MEEQAKTKVYEYYERPMSCKKCLKYWHTVHKCRETIAACARCNNQVHNKDKCTSTEVRCYNYEVDHQAFSRYYPKFINETVIIEIQTKERITRWQLIRKLFRLNSNPEIIFSYALKNTSNSTISKSLTSSDQENQSDSSSKDTSETDTSEIDLRVCRQSPNFYENFGREKDNWPTLTHGYFTKEKGKKKRSLPSPLLTLGGVWLKIPRK